MSFKYNKSTPAQRLTRVKTVAQRNGWVLVAQNEQSINFKKESRHLNIEGEMTYSYNVVEHSVTTTLNHNGTIKTLRRNIDKAAWNPVEVVLLYPRQHLGELNESVKYLKRKNDLGLEPETINLQYAKRGDKVMYRNGATNTIKDIVKEVEFSDFQYFIQFEYGYHNGIHNLDDMYSQSGHCSDVLYEQFENDTITVSGWDIVKITPNPMDWGV